MSVKKVVTNYPEKTTAEIFIYGVIGQDYSWSDSEKKEETLTDIEIVKSFRRLESEGITRLNVRINSPGGFERHGDPVINAIQTSKMDVHCYNDGICASKAADVFLAAKKQNRHMAKNAKLMIHAPLAGVYGNAKDLRKQADMLDTFQEAGVIQMASDTGLSEDEIRKTYYDYEDHWLTSKAALDASLIGSVEDYEAEGMPVEIEKMTFEEVLKHFSNNEDVKGQSLLQQAKERMLSAVKMMIPSVPQPQKSIQEMNIEEFKTAIENKEIKLEDVAKILEEQDYNVSKKVADTPPVIPAPPVKKTEGIDATVLAEAVKKALEPTTKTIEDLTAKVEKLEAEPGGDPTVVPSEGDQYKGMTATQIEAKKELDAFNSTMTNAAQGRGDISVV